MHRQTRTHINTHKQAAKQLQNAVASLTYTI